MKSSTGNRGGSGAMRSLRSAVLRPFGLSPFRSQAKPAATIAGTLLDMSERTAAALILLITVITVTAIGSL